MAYSDRWGSFLLEAVKHNNQSIRGLAMKAGMPMTTVQNYLSGRVPESMETVRKLAQACGGDPDDWVFQVKLFSLDVHMRDNMELSETDRQKILNDIAEIELNKQKKG